MTTTATRTTDRAWLLQLLGPERLADLTAPLNDDQAAQVEQFLDDLPAHRAILATTSGAEEADVVAQLIAEAGR